MNSKETTVAKKFIREHLESLFTHEVAAIFLDLGRLYPELKIMDDAMFETYLRFADDMVVFEYKKLWIKVEKVVVVKFSVMKPIATFATTSSFNLYTKHPFPDNLVYAAASLAQSAIEKDRSRRKAAGINALAWIVTVVTLTSGVANVLLQEWPGADRASATWLGLLLLNSLVIDAAFYVEHGSHNLFWVGFFRRLNTFANRSRGNNEHIES